MEVVRTLISSTFGWITIPCKLGNIENSGKTYLDQIEDNEIIRFLEIGIPVYCIDMIGDSWAVDEKKDIEIVEKRIKDDEKEI